ncbi:MAG: helix-turn-helix domain-containing protein [Anaerocolumna sp.]
MNYYVKHYDKQIEDKNSLKYVIRDEIMKANGSLKLAELSAYTGYSERYLNMKIHEDFVMNPKRLIRFQKSASTLINTIHCINCTDAAMESGYYDQSHFIKDFLKFSGLTPTGYIDNLLHNSYDKKLHVIN